jgi:hypothetical protein
MALNQEVWAAHIEELLWASNAFFGAATRDDQYVTNKVVHIPNQSGLADVVKNRSFSGSPATVTKNTDVDITYTIDEYTTDPILISNIDQVELSYDKRQSELQKLTFGLTDKMAANVLYSWAPTAGEGINNILRTTGFMGGDPNSTPASSGATARGATGMRLRFGVWDMIQAQLLMDEYDVPTTDRFMVIPSRMHAQLLADLSMSKYRDFSEMLNPKDGTIGRLFGFDIYTRSRGLVYSGDEAPVASAPGAATAVGDCEAVFFGQKMFARIALGEKKLFQHLDDPTYYGDVYSMLARLGATKTWGSELGVGAIVQIAPTA